MINWLRKKLGYCAHDWKFVDFIMCAKGWDSYRDQEIPSTPVGERAVCRICGEVADTYYPDGH